MVHIKYKNSSAQTESNIHVLQINNTVQKKSE